MKSRANNTAFFIIRHIVFVFANQPSSLSLTSYFCILTHTQKWCGPHHLAVVVHTAEVLWSTPL